MPDASQVAMPFIATDAPSVPVTLSPSTAAVTMLVALLGARDSAVFTGGTDAPSTMVFPGPRTGRQVYCQMVWPRLNVGEPSLPRIGTLARQGSFISLEDSSPTATQVSHDRLPDRLLAITLEDGVQYAWMADRIEESGESVMLLRHDPDGAVLRAAKTARGIDPDAPEVLLG
jgi:hypothetical protein